MAIAVALLRFLRRRAEAAGQLRSSTSDRSAEFSHRVIEFHNAEIILLHGLRSLTAQKPF
jgi:hypothetical protein